MHVFRWSLYFICVIIVLLYCQIDCAQKVIEKKITENSITYSIVKGTLKKEVTFFATGPSRGLTVLKSFEKVSNTCAVDLDQCCNRQIPVYACQSSVIVPFETFKDAEWRYRRQEAMKKMKLTY